MLRCLMSCLGGGARDDETPLQSSVPAPPTSEPSSIASPTQPGSEPPPPYSSAPPEANRQARAAHSHRQAPLSVADLKKREEDEMARAKRASLLHHIPSRPFNPDDSPDDRECPICMVDFESGDVIRSLPCGHSFHQECIDDWLQRSFTCPSCCEPVDAALLSSFHHQLLSQLPSSDLALASLSTSPATAGPSSKAP